MAVTAPVTVVVAVAIKLTPWHAVTSSPRCHPHSHQVQEASRNSGELLGGAKINHIFRTQFYEAVGSVDACAGLSDAEISQAIRQATGPRSPLFVPEGSFEVRARKQTTLLRPHPGPGLGPGLGPGPGPGPEPDRYWTPALSRFLPGSRSLTLTLTLTP